MLHFRHTSLAICCAVLMVATGCTGFARSDATLKERFLMKTGLGSASCALQGCVTCDDYCEKCLPSTPCVCGQCCDTYCSKCLPCAPPVATCCHDNYCSKCLPCAQPVSCCR
jgi:hypothetical protein